MKARWYDDFIPLEEIMDAVDLEKVAAAILTDDEGKEVKMAAFDLSDAKRLVWLAAEKWIQRDLFELKLEGLEMKLEMDVPGQRLPFKGFLDVAGVTQGRIDPFKSFAGKRVIIDWKTTRNDLKNATDWKRRLLDSTQWMCYSKAYGASVFLYRGLSRQGSTAELIIEVPETNDKEVIEYITGVGSQVNALRAGGFEVYPRNKPFACHAYNRDCPFKKDCENYTMPRQKLSEDKQLSYSFMNSFLLCPERARRESISEDGSGGSDETAFGKSVHSGLEELYKQAFEIFGEKN